jgi:hypothetical protein
VSAAGAQGGEDMNAPQTTIRHCMQNVRAATVTYRM